MKNECGLAARDFAFALTHLEQMERAAHEEQLDPTRLKDDVETVQEYIAHGRRALNNVPLPDEFDALTNLKNQAREENPSPYVVQRYAQVLRRTLLAEGLLALIDCECQKG